MTSATAKTNAQNVPVAYRDAAAADAPLILKFIKDLAVYEKLAHDVTATVDDIRQTMFGADPKAYCILAEQAGAPMGFCVYFYNYSTFQGKNGIYIEDIFVPEEYRGQGIGQGFFKALAQKAVAEGCGRIQWWVLDWNEPSINFYKSLGAKPMDEWTVFRLEGDAITNLARK